MSIIITRPEHDVTTRYLSSWGKKIIDVAKEKGLSIYDLHKEKVNQKEFTGRVSKLDPKLVLLNGHGSDDRVTGHDNKVLVKAGQNDNLLHNRITYALSCHSARVLGRKVTKKGFSTYIGYTNEFIFILSNNCFSRPLDDKRALPFMEASNQVAISLLKGHTAKESSNRSKEIFQSNYTKLLSSDTDPDSLQAAQCLWWNMKHQVCLGDKEMRFLGK